MTGAQAKVPRLVAVCAALLVALGAGAPTASALTRAGARRIALRALHPRGHVVVFGLPAPLRAGTRLAESGPGAFSTGHFRVQQRGSEERLVLRLRPARLKHRAWLFWEDRYPGALFAHPSVLLAIDARSGRIVVRKGLDWVPLVNGRRPAFLRTLAGYRSSRYRVHGRPTTAAAARVTHPPLARPALAPNVNLSGVCFVAVGATDEPTLKADFAALRQMGEDLHSPVTVVDRVKDLQKALNGNCSRVALFVLGHGSPPRDVSADGGLLNILAGGEPCVVLKGGQMFGEPLCADKLKAIIASHPEKTFDVQILSCFGGRFVPPLADLKNVLSVGSASGPKRVAQAHTDGTPSDFTAAIVDDMERWADDPGAVTETGGNITPVLEAADEDYGRSHLDRDPEYYDSVHGEIVAFDPAHPAGQEESPAGEPAVVACNSSDARLLQSRAQLAEVTVHGGYASVTVSPPGQTTTDQPYPSTLNVTYCYAEPVTVTVSVTPDPGRHFGGTWAVTGDQYAGDGHTPGRCDNDPTNRSPVCTLHIAAGVTNEPSLYFATYPPGRDLRDARRAPLSQSASPRRTRSTASCASAVRPRRVGA